MLAFAFTAAARLERAVTSSSLLEMGRPVPAGRQRALRDRWVRDAEVSLKKGIWGLSLRERKFASSTRLDVGVLVHCTPSWSLRHAVLGVEALRQELPVGKKAPFPLAEPPVCRVRKLVGSACPL